MQQDAEVRWATSAAAAEHCIGGFDAACFVISKKHLVTLSAEHNDLEVARQKYNQCTAYLEQTGSVNIVDIAADNFSHRKSNTMLLLL